MTIIFIIIIIILVLICFLLLSSIHYDFKLKKDGELEIKADVKYPFDIIKFHLDYFLLLNLELTILGIKLLNKTIDFSQKKHNKKDKEKNQKDDDNEKNKNIISKVLSLKMKDKVSLISNLKKDIPLLLKKIKPQYNKIIVELGFGNPFLLGALLGLLSTIKLVLKDLYIYPHFNKKVFKLDLELMSNIRLITLLIIVLKFRFSKKYRHIF